MWLPAALGTALAVVAVWLVLPAHNGTPASALSGTAGSPQSTTLNGPNGTTPWLPTEPDPDVAGTSDQPTQRTAVSVSIPSIGVESSLVPLGVDPTTGGLLSPASYDVAGVFSQGPVPGDLGPAVIAGHVDSLTGPGVFYRLEEVPIGATITVALSGGERIDFQAVEVARYPKSEFPTAEVYGPTPGRELRLITCGGSFDSSRLSYRDNIVIYAVRV